MGFRSPSSAATRPGDKHHMKHRLIAMFAVFGVLAAWVPSAAAATININFVELANEGGIQVYGTDASGTPFDVTKLNAETFGISSQLVPSGYSADLVLSRIGITGTDPGSGYLFALLESPGGPVSDYVWVHQFVPLFTVIDFVSNVDGIALNLPTTPIGTLVEDGTLQFVGSYLNDRGDTVNFSVQSDSEVPEPATLLLLGTGLGAVAARRRLKKRNA
jgi:ABC-type molybdate transport system substrate-binding protein